MQGATQPSFGRRRDLDGGVLDVKVARGPKGLNRP